MFNKVVLVGNLTRDIELRYSQSGMAIAKSAIATSRKFTTNGEKREEVMFIDITFFGRSGEIANQYLRKGSKILVEGRLNFEQWTDQNGQKRSKHSVTVENMQMLDSRADSAMQSGGAVQNGGAINKQSAPTQEYGDAPSYGGATNSYNDNSGYQNMQQQSTPTPSTPSSSQPSVMPEIDIDDDDIPF